MVVAYKVQTTGISLTNNDGCTNFSFFQLSTLAVLNRLKQVGIRCLFP